MNVKLNKFILITQGKYRKYNFDR